jgi:hypothetical protein
VRALRTLQTTLELGLLSVCHLTLLASISGAARAKLLLDRTNITVLGQFVKAALIAIRVFTFLQKFRQTTSTSFDAQLTIAQLRKRQATEVSNSKQEKILSLSKCNQASKIFMHVRIMMHFECIIRTLR